MKDSNAENWTLEYRQEAGGWELMQGSAHRGVFNSESDAKAALAELVLHKTEAA